MRRLPYLLLLISLMSLLSVQVDAQNGITIIHRTPAIDAVNIDNDSTITVVFSEPVMPLTGTADLAVLPAPVLITPPVIGTAEWLNTVVWQFTPKEPFPTNTTVTVRTNEAFIAANDSPLVSDKWHFTTTLARVAHILIGSNDWWRTPNTALDLDESIFLRFSQPLDADIITPQIQLQDRTGAPIPVTFEWLNTHEVTLTPIDPLQIASEYTLTVAESLNGQHILEAPFKQVIQTIPLPSVASVSPEPDSEVSINRFNNVSIQFATPMNLNSLEGRIRFEPDNVKWEVRTSPNDQRNISISFDPQPDQQYTITLLAGAEDIYGNTIDTDYSWTFTIVEPPPPALNAYIVTRNKFSVTNAHRENTRMAMRVYGDKDFTSNIALYRARNIADAVQTINMENIHYLHEEFSTALLEQSEHVRSWQQTFNGGGTQTVSEVPLADTEGGQLEPGLYVLLVDEYLPYRESPIVTRNLLLAVSTAVLTVRRSSTETLIWVTDMESGTPIGGVLVTLYARDGSTTTAITNQNGVARVPSKRPKRSTCPYEHCISNDYTVITAEASGVYGAWYSDRVLTNQMQVGNLYTDRRVYRPGDTVYFRGILRDKDDMTYTVPSVDEIEITLCAHSYCDEFNTINTFRVPVSYWGTINGSFTLPSDATPGLYHMDTDWGEYAFIESDCYSFGFSELYCNPLGSNGTQFTVATFDIPEFQMTAAPTAPEGIQDEPLGVTVNAQLYSGSPMRDARVDWSAIGTRGTFSHEDYHFSDSTLTSPEVFFSSGHNSPIDPIVTDTNGNAVIPTDTLISNVPLQVSMGVGVTEGGETHTARVSFFLHPGNIYVGLRPSLQMVQQGETITVELITVTPEHQSVEGQTVDYTIEHLSQVQRPTDQYGYYVWETVSTLVRNGTLISTEDGTEIITFPADKVGRYRVRAVTKDAHNRTHSSIIEIRVGDEPLPTFQGPTYDDKPFTIIQDQHQYQPGDTAHLNIQTPGDGTLLLTVQRQNIQRVFVLNISSTDPVIFELPIGYEDAPNVYIAGTFVQGMLSPDDSPSYASTSVNLPVRPVHRELKVELTSSTTETTPGEEVTFTVRVTDQRGFPVRAEIGMALVDEAVLSLAPSASPRLMDTFYSNQPDRVISSISLRGLVDDLTDQLLRPGVGGGGGGYMGTINASLDPRQSYETTPLWLPNVVTDENGNASVSMMMPDNLTRWRLDVRVVSLSTLVGQADLNLTSSLPFFVRPQTPRFLVVGDTVELAMIAHNETTNSQTISASIEADGVTLLDDVEQIITLLPHSQQRIAWRAQVDAVEAVSVTFFAGNDVVQDAARPDLPDSRIPVLTYYAPDTTATAGILDSDQSVTEVIHPPAGASESELRVSLASSLIDVAEAAQNAYPSSEHETIDRLIARLMINVHLYRIGADASLADAIERDIEQLKAKKILNGVGWNWTASNTYPDVYLTGYAVIAGREAVGAGFTTANEVITPICDSWYNWNSTQLLDASSTDSEFARQVFTQYIASLCNQYHPDVLDNLFAFRDRLSPFSKGVLLLTLLAAKQESASSLADQLLADAVISATGIHWQGTNSSFWDSDTLTTAVILRGLIAVDVDHEFIPNAVRWLIVARKGDLWSTPLDTAWSITTLLDYARAFETGRPTYTVDMSLDNTPIITDTSPTQLEETLTLPLTDSEHTITIERTSEDGRLYYTAVLHVTLDASTASPVSRGMTVMREYLDIDGNPIDSVELGESVFIRLTVIAPRDISYFVLHDPLPAGLIADDPSLISTTISGLSVNRTLPIRDIRWFFGTNAFSRSVYTDNHVQFYANALPAGTHVVTYEARASVAGKFQVMPTHAFAAMMPDIFGRGAGRLLSVTPSQTPVVENP